MPWRCVMSMHKTNGLLKYGFLLIGIVIVLILVLPSHPKKDVTPHSLFASKPKNSTASVDSAAESLDTLTAELSTTKQQVTQITTDNAVLKTQNETLLKKMQGSHDATTTALAAELEQLKNQIQLKTDGNANTSINNNVPRPINTVPDITETNSFNQITSSLNLFGNKNNIKNANSNANSDDANNSGDTGNKKPKIIPYYTIPANATAVHDRLMTSLVGRIPVKGVVMDPYPFKIVFSDDTLAANGLRVPHLEQMIVSGYSEGDLNLVSVRGWVTSLTFVFDDGTISTTSSNNNDVGHFTKDNALGYLSDPRGNPFIRGKLITNAPTYLSGNILLGAAQGAASAYSQAQTTSGTTAFGSNTSSVTGSPGAYVLGQSGMNAASQAQQWWHDREENSFDAVYVPSGQNIVVNFTKEVAIDYNPTGRKLDYEKSNAFYISRSLD